MEQNMFYRHVSSWIDSYYNADALEWLHRFVTNSPQQEEIKERLHLEIDRKIASLTNTPFFGKYDDMQLLMDGSSNGQEHPLVFTTRYAAMNKVIELRLMGYDVRLLEGNSFFRIQLIQQAPINFRHEVDELTSFAHGLRMSA